MMIGFVGRARSGKDTACTYFLETGFLEERVQLSGWLKRRCSDLFELPLNLLEGDNPLREKPFPEPLVFSAEHYVRLRDEVSPNSSMTLGFPLVGRHLRSPREVLQFVGTDVVRTLDPFWHVRKLCATMDWKKNVGVTDVRFSNEVSGLKSRGAVLVFVERGEAENLGHVSEQVESLAGACDFRVQNNGSLEDFYGKLDEVKRAVLSKKGG